ncbi:MAG: hypothetical protein A2X56_13820 [Nitrospirae bacterium GWC2_57_13]|nr:MAG: hypothetical protein A2X56_13820 [Nitrospirae bacterium GWC2_57_13]
MLQAGVANSTEITPALFVLVMIALLGAKTTLEQSGGPLCRAIDPFVYISTQISLMGSPAESST